MWLYIDKNKVNEIASFSVNKYVAPESTKRVKVKKKSKKELEAKQKKKREQEERKKLNKMWKMDDDNKNDDRKNNSNNNNNNNNNKLSWKDKQKLDEQKKKGKILKKGDVFEEATLDEMKDDYRPELKTINIDNIQCKKEDYINRSVSSWHIDHLLHYIISNAKTQNTFHMKSIIANLTHRAQETKEQRNYIIKNNGLNILLYLLSCDGDKDVAIAMSVTKCIKELCVESNTDKYPAEINGIFYLSTAIRNSYRHPIFCYTAFNCICNFTRGNPIHRNHILNNKHNSKIIQYIFDGMNKFRYQQNLAKNEHCVKVQISGCVALHNLAKDEYGRKFIGSEGVECVLDGFIAHVDNNDVVQPALNALKNLVANKDNANSFINADGIEYLSTLLQNPDVPSESREVATKILENLASEESTAYLLSDSDEIDEVCASLLLNPEYGTPLHLSVLKFLLTFITRLDKKPLKKIKLIKELSQRKLFNIFIDCLDHDFNLLSKKKMIMKFYY